VISRWASPSIIFAGVPMANMSAVVESTAGVPLYFFVMFIGLVFS
jgi:hypothetical protein